MSARDFPVLTPLYDVTIAELPAASGAVQAPVSGTQGSAASGTHLYITTNVLPNNTAAMPSGLVGEVLVAEVTPPVVQTADGSLVYPDLMWWLVPDNTDLQKFQNFDGAYGTNMMPNRENTVGRAQVLLGISTRRLLTEASNGAGRRNMSMLMTGIKFASTIQIKVQTTRGIGIAGDRVIVPGRIRLWGERYSLKLLDYLAPYYDGNISKQALRRALEGLPPIQARQAGSLSIDQWASMPGGYDQGRGAEIHRFFNFAQNLVATGASTPFILSNNPNVGGAAGNVGLHNDLGLALSPVQGNAANAREALIIQQFGVAGGIANIAFAGFQVGGSNIPDPNGYPVGTYIDRFAYGQVGPMRAESHLWYPLPDLEGEMEIWGENAAVQVTANGTAIAASAANVAIGGVRIKLPAARN